MMTDAKTAPKTNVEIQRAYRMRMAGKGLTRINQVVKDDAKICLDMMAEYYGHTKRHMLERLIFEHYERIKHRIHSGDN